MNSLFDTELYEAARRVAANAYVPFSKFPVGAALRMEDGTIVTGTNVDNASYPLTLCAERGALSTAIATRPQRVTGVGVHAEAWSASPCGGCRQVLAEHAAPGCLVTFRWQGALTTVGLDELLPYPFQLEGPPK